jgi:EpsG family
LYFYISMALLFWAFVPIAVSSTKEHKGLAICSVVFFIAIAGLRLETGYDWIAYESALNDAPSIFNFTLSGLPPTIGQMEPLFIVLLSIIKTLGASIQFLYFVVALFNGIVFYIFVRYCRASVIVAFATYFCWAYLLAQMGIIRQSIAISFLMLSLIRFDKSKYWSTFCLFVIALLFQNSILMFTPIFLVKKYKKLIKYRTPLMLGLLLFYFLDLDVLHIFGLLTGPISVDSLGVLGTVAGKIQFYLEAGESPKSIGATAYLILNSFSFIYFMRIHHPQSPIEKSLMISLFMMIAMQAMFWQFPLLWSRGQYFVVTAQAILLYKTWPSISKQHRQIQVILVFALSIAALIKPLLNDTAIPYMPYMSILTDEPGNGRNRLEQYNSAMGQ